MFEGMLNDICGKDVFNSIFETLTVNLFAEDGRYASVLEIAEKLYTSAIMPLAVMLLFVYFAIAMVDKMSQENFTWEQLWKTLAMLLVSKYLIEHGFELLKTMFDIGMAFAADIQEFTGYEGDTATAVDAEEILDNFKDSLGIFNIAIIRDVILFIYLLVPWLLSWVMRLCVSVICYSRVVEIYVRASVAPIALSDFFHSGMQGSGWRFLKNFLAVCLQGGLILIIAVVYSSLMGTIVGDDRNLFTFIGTYLAFLASAIMLMFKSLALTKEIVGAN